MVPDRQQRPEGEDQAGKANKSPAETRGETADAAKPSGSTGKGGNGGGAAESGGRVAEVVKTPANPAAADSGAAKQDL